MTNKLEGQVALVSGSGRGIGRAIALAYASAGAQVVVTARSQDQIDSVCGEIGAAGGTAIAVRADVTNRADVVALIAQTLEAFGRIDIVINNTSASASVEWTVEAWRNSFEVDLMGAVAMNETALPWLEASSTARGPLSVVG